MLALSPMMRGFVNALLVRGDDNHTAAAIDAGYSTASDGAIRVQAHRLAHDDRVLAAVREEADRRIRSSVVMAASVVAKIAANPMHKDQLKAASMILNRTGLNEVTQHEVKVTHELRGPALDAKLALAAKQLGIPVENVLGVDAIEITDAEFTEVEPDAPTAEGLEDLL